jgi:phage terminase large subunit-like protein
VNAGQRMRLYGYQRDTIECLLSDGVRTGGLQIPRGNAKSTLCAAIGLWAICDLPDAPQVPLVAFNALQARRTLFQPASAMVRMEPNLINRVGVYTSNTDPHLLSWWNRGELHALPANVERLQGLNPTVALVDEAQTVPPDVFGAILQGAGKRAESLVLAIGTPSPRGHSSALFDLRERHEAGAPVAWVEYAAPAGCQIDDRHAWATANPALRAGILFDDVLDAELSLVPEPEFRLYRLGQWIEGDQAAWLPVGCWDAQPHEPAPDEGVEVVLGLAGTWARNSLALVGSTLDGAQFVAWCAEAATDETLEAVLSEAFDRWQVVQLVVAPRVRPSLTRRLMDAGMAVEVWPNRLDIEIQSSTEWRRAIVEGRVPHDHQPALADAIAKTVSQPTPDGAMRLTGPDPDADVDAARAARMSWWRAVELADEPAPAVF